ncbi:MAG TPA: hypothetical protein VFC51_03040 [Chloroflexota bacterium]|nr:hypothetical protein [Chloroflexota bacterium]
MPRVGEQGDVLRALGRSLDEQGARRIEIKSHEVFFAVSWATDATAPEQRAYQEHDLESLRVQARAMRQGVTGATRGASLAELLRTLGQQLDEEGIEMTALFQDDDGFRVSGVGAGRYQTRLFETADLIAMSVNRKVDRGTGPSEPPPDPLSNATLGVPVVTQDGQRIGKLAEIRPGAFKVGAPMLQRDYWLTSDCVASTGPGEPLVLSLTKAQVDQRKLRTAPVE